MIKSTHERFLFERPPIVGIMIVDMKTATATLSRDLAPLYGLPASMAGRPVTVERIFEAMMPEDRQPLEEVVQRTVETGEVLRVRYRVRNLERQWRWVSVEGQCFYDSEGHSLTYPVAVRDVTDTVESGNDIESLGNHLLEALRISNDYRMHETSTVLKTALSHWGEAWERPRH